MTLLAPLFGGESKAATVLTVRDDIITSDRVLGDYGSMWGSIALDTDYTQTYEQIAQKQLWVRIVLNKWAYSIARMPLKTYARRPNGREQLRGDGLSALIDAPNTSKETGTTEGLVARVVYDLGTYSNALIVKVQAAPDSPVVQLQPVSPVGWSIDGDTYVHRSTTGDQTRVPAWRMIHIVEPGPTRSGFGVSRLEAARLTLAIEYMAQRLGEATFKNGARPGGIINVKSTGMKPEVIERFKSEVMRRFGGVNKAGLPAVLEGDVSWQAMAHNLDDSAVVQHRQLTREEVAALYDIPQPAIGILDEANFASIDILHVMLYQDALSWPIKLIESALNRQLVSGVPDYENLYLEFDMNSVMRGDIESRYRAYATGIQTGFLKPGEVRSWENLPASDQPQADQLLFPMNLSGAVGAQLAEDTEV